MDPLNLGVLASHNGTNLQAIIKACEDKTLNARCRVVISNNSRSIALHRARYHEISAVHLSGKTHPDPHALDSAIENTLSHHDVSLVVLAGYMKLLGPKTLSRYRGRIVNIHPGPLPEFGGQSMYGDRVHRAVLDARRPTTGVTVHLVDELYDHGNILDSTEVEILDDDTVETLRDRVQTVEHSFFVDTLRRFNTKGFQFRFKHWPRTDCNSGKSMENTLNWNTSNRFSTNGFTLDYSNMVHEASAKSADYILKIDNPKRSFTKRLQLELKFRRRPLPQHPYTKRPADASRSFQSV